MANDTDPWQEIDEPSNADVETLRRVEPEHKLNFYRGKLFGGGYFLRLVINSKISYQPELPKLSNITTTLLQGFDGQSELTITLKNPNYVELFRVLCADLISSTRFLKREDEEPALQVVVARILRWQELLSGKQLGVMSVGKQLGLFGELMILRDIFLGHTDTFSALSAWQGPSGAEQDFQFAKWLFEVKSQMASSDRLIRLSSEHQLDLVSGKIGLFHQVFSTSSEDLKDGRTLRQLIDEVRQLVLNSDPVSADLFQARLIEIGYEPLEEYDKQSLILTGRNAYEVIEGFPRISASDIPMGISNVRYNLSLEACSAFQIDEKKLLRKAFDVN